MNNQWKMEEFAATEINENIINKKFVVPKYQRGIVWRDSQKLELIDTIKKGLPFGTLLLYKDEKSKYQIIDGVQRSTVIIEFVKNPAQFFDDDDIILDDIKKILILAGVRGNIRAQEEKIKNMLVTWVKNEHKTLQAVEEMQYSKFGKLVAEEFPTCKNKEIEIGDSIAHMMGNYKAVCKKINSIRIPAIVLTGDSEYLPILFERINSKGTQLSKYEIYAATWHGYKYKISDDLSDLLKANRDRYYSMYEGEATIDDYDSIEFMNKKEMDTFEIAFGFGKYLCKKWPHLFGSSKDENTVESIGFTLINSCLCMKNNNLKSLNTKLNERVGKDINTFLLAIIDAVSITDKVIGKFSMFKSNSRSKSFQRPLHTEFQIASIITSVFICKYATIKVDDKDNVDEVNYNFEIQNFEWKKDLYKKFRENVSKIYIMEILKRRWSGTGDKKLDMIFISPQYYTKEIRLEEFEVTLDNWFETHNREREEFKKIATPKEGELLIIAALYLDSFTAVQQVDGSNYDIEHLAPKNLMKKHLDRFDGNLRLPISSLGNLCLLPEYENRSKGDKTIYKDLDYLKKSELILDEIEKKYSFTTESSMMWIEDFSSTLEEFEENYMTFIKWRYNHMKELLLEKFNSM